MSPLDTLVHDLLSLPATWRTQEQLILLKRKYAKEQKSPDILTNMQIFKTYNQLVQEWKAEKQPWLENLLKKRSVRSESGIVPIQVLTKPFRCPGKCIFCPNDATMPKSYINTQPGAMRAMLNQFDPYKQAYNRLLSLTLTWHATDKIEMIVLGWTRDVYPKKYKTRFIKGLYDACNEFDNFMKQIDIDFTAAKAARYTPIEGMELHYPETIQESLAINETSNHRVIGLTIETRPEYVTDVNCQYRRSMGITRLEMWIQSLDDQVLDMNKRGHGTKEIFAAMHKLRQYGFKFSTHIMPGLYGSSYEKDLETFQIAYSTPWVKPDEIKFYPTAVIPNTELYDLYMKGEYQPLTAESLEKIIRISKTEVIPPYTRIKRLARDFDTNEVVAWANTPNLRQLVMNQLDKEFAIDQPRRETQYKRLAQDEVHIADEKELVEKLATPMTQLHTEKASSGGLSYIEDARYETYLMWGVFDVSSPREFICLCTRCREVRHADESLKSENLPFLVIRRYRSSVGEELFMSYEDTLGYIYGFTRLLLPDHDNAVEWEGLGEGTALIRELHVYGQVAKISSKDEDKTQHKWIGGLLMHNAEVIARQRGYERLSVISGIGVRWYYKKLWYEVIWTYLVKNLGMVK